MSSHFNAYVRCWDRLDVMEPDDSEEADLLRDQMDFHWYRLTPKEIEALKRFFQRRLDMTIATSTLVSRQPKWSEKPLFWIADYETFIMLRYIHRCYHQTIYDVARWVRWDRKTINQTGPEPKYCDVFVEDKPQTRACVHKNPETGESHAGFYIYPKTLRDWGYVDTYQAARHPYKTSEKAEMMAAKTKIYKEKVEATYQACRKHFGKSLGV